MQLELSADSMRFSNLVFLIIFPQLFPCNFDLPSLPVTNKFASFGFGMAFSLDSSIRAFFLGG
jgi:hypothetical protein